MNDNLKPMLEIIIPIVLTCIAGWAKEYIHRKYHGSIIDGVIEGVERADISKEQSRAVKNSISVSIMEFGDRIAQGLHNKLFKKGYTAKLNFDEK